MPSNKNNAEKRKQDKVAVWKEKKKEPSCDVPMIAGTDLSLLVRDLEFCAMSNNGKYV